MGGGGRPWRSGRGDDFGAARGAAPVAVAGCGGRARCACCCRSGLAGLACAVPLGEPGRDEEKQEKSRWWKCLFNLAGRRGGGIVEEGRTVNRGETRGVFCMFLVDDVWPVSCVCRVCVCVCTGIAAC